MSSVIASGITSQTSPLLSSGKSNDPPAQKEKVANSTTVSVALSEVSRPAPTDTISISSPLRQTINDVKKEFVKKEETSKENSREKPNGVTSKVQFAYDMKGDLSVRYMDTSNNLIYQVPSELMLRLKEAELKSDSSVDTKA